MSLTAPPAVQARLLDLQALDTKLVQLARALEALPVKAEITAVTAEIDEASRSTAGLLGTLEDHRTELGRVEADVKVVEARIARDENLLQGAASAKDTQGIDSELANLRRRRSELEDIELAIMEQVEQAETLYAAAQAAAAALTARREELTAQLGAETAATAAEQATVAAQRGALAASLPDDLVALYEKQRARYGFGATLLRRRVSTAGGVELTGSDLEKVRQAAPDAVILCPESSAILIRTDESGL